MDNLTAFSVAIEATSVPPNRFSKIYTISKEANCIVRILNTKTDFTHGDIIKSLIVFSLPIVLGELFQNLYNSVDAIVVGNLVSERALAAVTVGGVISNMVVNFFNGMSVGANVVVSTAFGRKDSEELRSKICIAFSFSVMLGICLSLLGIVFTPQLLRFAGVQQEYYAEALVYLRIYLAGILFTVIYNNGAGILRATGDSSTPFKILLLTCCTNIVLDVFFVGVLQLGVEGVGFATVFSQGISVMLVYRAINRNQRIRCLDFNEMFRHGRDTILSVLRIGMTAGMQSALIGFSNIFVVRYMNCFDTAAVAGIGIAQRLDKFIVLPAKSFGITITTYVSQNIGAKRYDRVLAGRNRCMSIALCVTVSLSAIVFVFSEQSVMLFNSDPAVVSVGVAMMRVLIPAFWVIAIREVLLGTLRGCGENAIPMILSLVGMIGCRQLFLAISMHFHPVIENIYICYPVAWAATTLLLLFYYRIVRSRLPGIGYTPPFSD